MGHLVGLQLYQFCEIVTFNSTILKVSYNHKDDFYLANSVNGKHLLSVLIENDVIHVWPKDKPEGWQLFSGLWSPYYINLRGIGSKRDSKRILNEIATDLWGLIKKEIPETSRLVGVATGGIPITTALAMVSGIPFCYTRKVGESTRDTDIDSALKKYGEHDNLVEGDLHDGDCILLVDDCITTGSSKILAKKSVDFEAQKRGISLNCKEIAVIVDRRQGSKILEENSMNLHSLIIFDEDAMDQLGSRISNENLEALKKYLENSTPFQDSTFRNDLKDKILKDM